MPKYRVAIPIYSRSWGFREVYADSSYEAVESVKLGEGEYKEEMPDYDYCETRYDEAHTTKLTTDMEDLAATHTEED